MIQLTTDAHDKIVSLLQSPEKKDKEKGYSMALQLFEQFPTNVAFLFLAANAHREIGAFPDHKGALAIARILYKHCVQCKEEFPEAYNNLGVVSKSLGLREEAIEFLKKSYQYQPNDADIVNNYGANHVAFGMTEKAIEIIEGGLKDHPGHIKMLGNLGMAYLEKGQYDKGFELYSYHDKEDETRFRTYGKEKPQWDGSVGKGKTVVVYGEQGLGDEIMFASVLPDMMKDVNVIFDCHERLQEIFRQSFPGLSIYGTRNELNLYWPNNHKIDAQIRIGDLAAFYRKNESDFPGTAYLKADADLSARIGERVKALGKRPKIGISWVGGTNSTNLHERKIPIELLKPILRLDAEFISLQYNKETGALLQHAFSEGLPTIHHWQDILNDYDMTAALLDNLDLVISVPQSVVHLAGAMGVNTWQLCPKRGLWQQGEYGKDALWYKSVKNYWQVEHAAWEELLGRVEADLKTFIEDKKCN